MPVKDYLLTRILAIKLALNLLIATLAAADLIRAQHAFPAPWPVIIYCGASGALALWALRSSRDLNSRLMRLSQIDRLFSE